MSGLFIFGVIFLAVVCMVISISKFNMHPFLVLTVIAVLVGLVCGIPTEEVISTVKSGFGNILASIGIVILAGTIIGTILEKTGAALTMANTILKIVGKEKSVLTMGITSYITGIPVFCDSGFVILSPISRALASQSNVSLAVMATALSGGLYATHCLVPPTPGPIAMAGTLEADLGLTILVGLIISIPAVASALIYANKVSSKIDIPANPEYTVEELVEKYGKLPGALHSFSPILLPIILILLFGYGISFDVENAKVAVVVEDSSGPARDLAQSLGGSKYLVPVRVKDYPAAVEMMEQSEALGILRIPVNFGQQYAAGDSTVQLILNGVDAQTAKTIQGYVMSAVANWGAKEAARRGGITVGGGISVVQRIWFNPNAISTWYLVPGIIVLIMTLIGTFLASMLIAREWERGTFESLFVTPVRPFEIALAKVAPYLVIGIIDIAICLLAARFLFKVPIRGSLVLIVLVSILYLLVSLLMGLLVSGVTRNQFLASQMALLVSFMPAVMFSGFVFDLRNMPGWIQPICEIFPATHFMKVAKLLFLAGNDASVVSEGVLILLGYTILFLILTTWTLRKRVE